MTKLLITRGAPACGKSTFAREWVAEDPNWRARVNRDDLRQMIQGKDYLDRMGEETVSTLEKATVRALLDAQISVIVDATNLRAAFVKEWLVLAKQTGVEVEFVDFDTSLEQCLTWNRARADAGGRFVPEDVIRSFFARFYQKGKLVPPPVLAEDVQAFKVYEPNDNLPMAYLVDIDGTLADMSGNGRGPFDWARVGEDLPIKNVIRVVRALEAAGYTIVFMSGRDEVSRQATLLWLLKHYYVTLEDRDYDFKTEIYMRPQGDMRKDSIVKHELFYKHVADKYHVVGVIDDRQQVVDMWRQIGLTVLQCAKGDF